MKTNQVTSIKCRFSNSVHKLLDKQIGIKRDDRWKHRVTPLSDNEKIKLFDEIMKLHNENSEEISNALYKRRERKRVETARLERGYVPKKKTTKEEFEKVK